jgi:hypothetical protein
MAAQDIRNDVEAWLADEIGKQCFGEDFGWAVTWGPAPVPNGQGGMVMIPAWTAIITMQNPMLGEGELYHVAQLGAPRPKEADVRAQVTDGLRQLRELAKSKIGGSNGRARRAVPG